MPIIASPDYEFDVREELERKVAEACDELTNRFKRGVITAGSFRVGLEALRAATGGLIANALTMWIDQAINSLKAHHEREVHVLHKDNDVVIVMRELGDDAFKALKFKARQFEAKSMNFSDSALDGVMLAKENCKKLEDGLYARGWTEI